MAVHLQVATGASSAIVLGINQMLKFLAAPASAALKTGTSLAKSGVAQKTAAVARRTAPGASLAGSGVAIGLSMNGGNGGFAMNGTSPSGATAPAIYSWSTGTAVFYRLQNGKIGTWKKDGVWKEWRPYKPVVIPKKWSSKSMGRVSRALKRQQKTAIDIVKMTGGDASKSRRSTTRTKGMRYDGKDLTMIRN